MNRWLQAAVWAREAADKTDNTDTTPENAQNAGVTSVVSVVSVEREGETDHCSNGHRRAWTGRIVRLEDWRNLSEWERKGPDGRLFCGRCRQWLPKDVALSHLENGECAQ